MRAVGHISPRRESMLPTVTYQTYDRIMVRGDQLMMRSRADQHVALLALITTAPAV
jgi:hypothetical protein